jgi:hypothetical protein
MVLGSGAAEIAGRVADFAGNPIPGVVVTIHRQTANARWLDWSVEQLRPIHVRSAADGSFHCAEVPRGSVIVAAISSDRDQVPTSELVEVGAELVYVELRIGKGATLEGTITDGGVPLERCTVVVRCLRPEMPMTYWFPMVGMRFGRSDAGGNYRITGILPGDVDVRVDTRGVPSLGASFGFHTRSVREGEVLRWDPDLSADQRSSLVVEIEPKRAPGKWSSWSVLVSRGDALSGDSASQRADESGQARFERLAAGRYTALVSCTYQVDELEKPVYLPMLKREFDLSEKLLTLRIPDELLHLQRVRGRLVDPDGNGLASRALRLQTNVFPAQTYLTANTDSRGAFVFPGLPSGRYTLEQFTADTSKAVGEFTVVGERAEELGDIVVR